VIFFGENITSLSQIAGVVAQLKEANDASSPLLLMTDQEGGIVRRLPGQPTMSERQIGESANPGAAASAAGTGAGQNLAGVGMNTNLAPVLDVYRQPGNFDDEFGRSYSEDPNVCAECGAAMITAQQALNIAATAKHFPGLGAATVDQNTDLGPVTLNVPLADLRGIDELPFGSAIAAGVQMVMTSWATYPALDPDLPSGLSPAIVGGELRQRLKFRGVTITDALEAGAIASFGTPAECSVLAARCVTAWPEGYRKQAAATAAWKVRRRALTAVASRPKCTELVSSTAQTPLGESSARLVPVKPVCDTAEAGH
jgi:beta-N-acetylhexosaminidase